MESCLTSLGRVSLAYPDYAGFNKAVGVGGKKQAHGLARGKGGVGLQSQAIRGEVNGSADVFSLVTPITSLTAIWTRLRSAERLTEGVSLDMP